MTFHPLVPDAGSSPLVRGALRFLHISYTIVGIIPARAGSTLSARSPSARRGDHPRSCGEHLYLT